MLDISLEALGDHIEQHLKSAGDSSGQVKSIGDVQGNTE
jgi:hypothetical protein